MYSGIRFLFALLIPLGLAGAAAAQQLMIYPKAGQDQKQQTLDKSECQAWATGQTGFDPLNPTVAAPQAAAEWYVTPLGLDGELKMKSLVRGVTAEVHASVPTGAVAWMTAVGVPRMVIGTQTAEHGSPSRSERRGHDERSSLLSKKRVRPRRAAGQPHGVSPPPPGAWVPVATAARRR